MKLFRIAKKKHADDISGLGSKLAGGRWNKKGLPAIYVSQSASLALLETIVHCQYIGDLYGRMIVELEMPSKSIKTIDITKFSKNWNQTPWNDETVKLGSQWLLSSSELLLKIPSAIVPFEYNYIINPNYKSFSSIRITKKIVFSPDKRLQIL